MQTALNRMGRNRLFPLLFQNGCSQSSRFPTAGQGERGSGNEIGLVENTKQIICACSQNRVGPSRPLGMSMLTVHFVFGHDVPAQTSLQVLAPVFNSKFSYSTVAPFAIRNRISIAVYLLLCRLDNLQHHLRQHLEIVNLPHSLVVPMRDHLLYLQLCDIYRVLGRLP